MTISDNALDTSIWSDVRTKVVALGLAVTAQTTGIVTTASINSSYNDKAGARPQIIINPIIVSESWDKYGTDEGMKVINVVIDCYAENSLGADQLAVGIRNLVKSNPFTGMELLGIETDVAFNTSAEQKYQMKSLSCSFSRE